MKIAQGKGNPEGNRRGTGTGQRPKGTNRRTPDEGKPEDGGRRGRTRRANGKPEESPPGTPEAVRSGPKPPGESPGIWGHTHLRRRWRSAGRAGRAARLAQAHLAPPGPAGPSDARRGLARAAACVPWIRDQSAVSGGWEYVPAGRDAHPVPGVCRPLTEVGRIRIQNGCRTAVTQGYTPRRLKLRLKRCRQAAGLCYNKAPRRGVIGSHIVRTRAGDGSGQFSYFM